MAKKRPNLIPRCYLCDGGIKGEKPLEVQQPGSAFPFGFVHRECLISAADAEWHKKVLQRAATIKIDPKNWIKNPNAKATLDRDELMAQLTEKLRTELKTRGMTVVEATVFLMYEASDQLMKMGKVDDGRVGVISYNLAHEIVTDVYLDQSMPL